MCAVHRAAAAAAEHVHTFVGKREERGSRRKIDRSFVRSFVRRCYRDASLCVARDPTALRHGGRRTNGCSVPKSPTIRSGLKSPLAFLTPVVPSRLYSLPSCARSFPREYSPRSRELALSNLNLSHEFRERDVFSQHIYYRIGMGKEFLILNNHTG